MPHTNRKKKSATKSAIPRTKPTIVHTKRKEIQDDDGWTHVVDAPRSRRSTVSKAANGGLHAGDFEINGMSYINRTLEEMRLDFEYWRKSWDGSEACERLRNILQGQGEEKSEVKDDKLVEEQVQNEGEKPAEQEKEEKHAESNEEKLAVEETGEEVVKEAVELVERGATEGGKHERLKVDNIVVLGLGSLQSSRREGRRATATQLAALQTIINTFGEGKNMKIILQEPQFTTLDNEFLTTLGYDVVDDPEAFGKITESSLVYAIHCYAQVYKAVSEGKRPALLIGTDVDNFGRFNLSGTAGTIQKALEEMVEDCEVISFPQVRHDFSDTKIYWRKQNLRVDQALTEESALKVPHPSIIA